MVRRLRFVTMILPVLTSLAMTLGAAGVWAQETAAPPVPAVQEMTTAPASVTPKIDTGTRPGCSYRLRWFWQ